MKAPPKPDLYDLQAEQVTLGEVLQGGRDAWAKVAALIGPDDFFGGAHAAIARACEQLAQLGAPIDLTTVNNQLEHTGAHRAVGALVIQATGDKPGSAVAALMALSDLGLGGAEHLTYHAKLVKEKAAQRQVILSANSAERAARRGDLPGAAQAAAEIRRATRPPGRPAKPRPPRQGRAFERGSDVELGRGLLDELEGQSGQVVHAEGSFWRYADDRGVWQAYTRPELERRLHAYDGAQLTTGRALSIGDQKVVGALKRAAAEAAEPDFFSRPGQRKQQVLGGVVLKNGALVLEGSKVVLRPHSPDHRARALLEYNYVPAAPCPLWTSFWQEVFAPDADAEEKVALVQEFVGACVLGIATHYERALVLVGASAANGKSTMLRVVEALFPPGSVAVVPPHSMAEHYHRAKLHGALLNIVTELSPRELLATEALKAVISGDKIEAREPAKPAFSFRPSAGHLYAANDLPPIADPSGGPWRRLTPVEFNRSFEGDPTRVYNLAERIIATELEGVAAWAVTGAQRLLSQGGYTMPQSTLARTQAWREDSDQVLSWALDRLTTTHRKIEVVALPADITELHKLRPYFPLKTSELYEDYRKWCRDTGHQGVLSLKRFSGRLAALGPTRHEFNDGVRWNVTFRSTLQIG